MKCSCHAVSPSFLEDSATQLSMDTALLKILRKTNLRIVLSITVVEKIILDARHI